MNKKRKFRITLNESRAEGAELKIGTVSVEFVKYWQKRDGLIKHLESIVDGEEEDANSPPMRDGKNFPWNECDDIEGILSPYEPTVNGFKVEEITAKGDVIIEESISCHCGSTNLSTTHTPINNSGRIIKCERVSRFGPCFHTINFKFTISRCINNLRHQKIAQLGL